MAMTSPAIGDSKGTAWDDSCVPVVDPVVLPVVPLPAVPLLLAAAAVAPPMGELVGVAVGAFGAAVGEAVGAAVGAAVGEAVGT